MSRGIPALILLITQLIPVTLISGTPTIRVLILEDASNAKVQKSGDGLSTWLDGRRYRGDIVIEKTSPTRIEAINIVPLEEYIEGILPAEMPSDWPAEALKAQAVTARTYAYYIHNEKNLSGNKTPYDLKSTIEDQVYQGAPHANLDIIRAVRETEGEIISYHGKPIKTYFHSSCGGETETSIHVWGENDVMRSIKDPYCANSPHNTWRATLRPNEIANRLRRYGFDPGRIREIKPEEFEKNGRVAAVAIHGDRQTISLTGNDFRRYLGFEKIKSTLFTVEKTSLGFLFTGRGFGHGVGMCQWGAKGMAEMGYSYGDILNFYYPGTEIKKVY